MAVGILRVDLDPAALGTPVLVGAGTAWSGAGGTIIGTGTTAYTGVPSVPEPVVTVNQGLTGYAAAFAAWGYFTPFISNRPGGGGSQVHWKATVTWSGVGVNGPTSLGLEALDAVDGTPQYPLDGNFVPNNGVQQVYVSPDFGSGVVTEIGSVQLSNGQTFNTHYTFSLDELFITYDLDILVHPNTGINSGGDAIDIYGAGFTGVTTVLIDGNTCTSIVVVNDYHITAVTPAGTSGAKTVTVGSATFAGKFSYVTYQTAPTVDAGGNALVTGPAPSIVTTAATVTPGIGNGSLTYAWTQLSGPATPTIASPSSVNTNITFAAYVLGDYVFQLAVSTTTIDGLSITTVDTVTYTIATSVAPVVTSGSTQVTWPTASTTITPVVVDDGWGGTLSYAWALIYGPGTPTIASPSALSTLITIPNTPGTYKFSLTVSRSGDALVGVGYWNLTVYTPSSAPSGNTGVVTMTVNGSSVPNAIVETFSIDERAQQIDICTFKMHGTPVSVWDDIVLTRGGIRLFAGICMSLSYSFESNNLMYQPGLSGYAWHLTRTKFTKTYGAQPMGAIISDLMTLAQGNITATYVASGLPSVAVSFTDQTILEALNTLAKMTNPPCHVRVDYDKKLHFAIVDPLPDPAPLVDGHPSLMNFTLIRDAGQTVNRITLNYTQITSVVPVAVSSEIDVTKADASGNISHSLDSYSPSGGTTIINGNTITYTGTAIRSLNPVSGVEVQTFVTPVNVTDGQFGTGVGLGYEFTIVTSDGETTVVAGNGGTFPGSNAMSIKVYPLGTPGALARILRINIYRVSNEGAGAAFLVGSVNPTPGSEFVDKIALANVPTPLVNPPSVNTADPVRYLLTGCTGTNNLTTQASVTVNNTTAQSVIAGIFGGGDTGVIAITMNAGTMSQPDAFALASSILAASGIKDTVTGDIIDDNAHPGNNMAVNFSALFTYVANLKIQQVTVRGFTTNKPHYHSITAAPEIVTLEDLLRNSDTLNKG